MDYLPLPISCHLEALQYTLGTWQVKLISDSVFASHSSRDTCLWNAICEMYSRSITRYWFTKCILS
jgi:hypothetical protein